jgi:excisionase family DNA binding protein
MIHKKTQYNNNMKIVTIKELSALLKVKEKTLYQWAELGQIPSVKLNGALRFDLEDVMRWIKDCKKEVQNSYNPLTQASGPRKGGR